MRIKLVLATFCFCQIAAAEIYKYVDPVTGAVQYSNQPKQGSTRVSSRELPTNSPCSKPVGLLATDNDVFAEYAFAAKCEKAVEAKRHAAAIAALAREYPGACSKTSTGLQHCQPRVGMHIERHAKALEMRRDGFTEDAVNGKLDRWRGVCTAYSRRGVVVSVTC